MSAGVLQDTPLDTDYWDAKLNEVRRTRPRGLWTNTKRGASYVSASQGASALRQSERYQRYQFRVFDRWIQARWT